MWQYHDGKMKELKQLYDKTSKQTQNRLQEIFDMFKITNDNLYNIADNKTKKRVNEYIEEWKDKGLLNGYFGMLANNIYKRNRVKNSEILELMIYSAFIEEQAKIEEKEMQIFKKDASYYYTEGINEVRKEKKHAPLFCIIPDAILLAMIEQANAKGYTYEMYKQTMMKSNADQIYRQALIDLQQQKELDITESVYQNIIAKQQNQKLCINGDKISGDIDMTMIGINNMAKVEGIVREDDGAKVVFLANIDGNETPMCHSLHRQEFYVDRENEFNRYYGETPKDLQIQQIKCYGLVLGINLPPINHHFHWCRSMVKYVPPTVEKQDKTWYNKLGNSNKNSIGGSGKGTFIEKISKEEIPQKLKQYEEDIRNMPIEYAVLIDKEGNVYSYQGAKSNLDITDRSLDGSIITHNHPEVGSFGKDDYNLLYINPKIEELRAVDEEYTYSLKLIKPLDITYNELYREGMQIAFETGEEIQHCTMLRLQEMGYIKYERRRKSQSKRFNRKMGKRNS